MAIDWDVVFETVIKKPAGLSEDGVREFLDTCLLPLTDGEIAEFDPADAPRSWKLPEGPLPESYLSLLRWSNGGEFENGDRLLQFFPAVDDSIGVRTTLLAYAVPRTAPGILPFAFNGGGVFYGFDMRFHPIDGEYRIVAVDSGDDGRPFPLADTFLEACRDRRSIEELWDE